MCKLTKLEKQYSELMEVVEALNARATEIASDQPGTAQVVRLEAQRKMAKCESLLSKIKRIETYHSAAREVEEISLLVSSLRMRHDRMMERGEVEKAVEITGRIEEFYEKRKKAQITCELAYRALYMEGLNNGR